MVDAIAEIRRLCAEGTEGHGDEFYGPILKQIDMLDNGLAMLNSHYGITDGFIGNGCEHGFKPAVSCPNLACDDRIMHETWEKMGG